MVCLEEARICLSNDVSVEINGRVIIVSGNNGVLSLCLHDVLRCVMLDRTIVLKIGSKKRYVNSKSLLGTTRSLLCSMLLGVTVGFMKKLQLVGVGYRAAVIKDVISLTVGFSHVVNYRLPSRVSVVCPTSVDIILSSADKQLVGQVAADIRAIRPPQPFSGKGIRYFDEVLRVKDVKKK